MTSRFSMKRLCTYVTCEDVRAIFLFWGFFTFQNVSNIAFQINEPYIAESQNTLPKLNHRIFFYISLGNWYIRIELLKLANTILSGYDISISISTFPSKFVATCVFVLVKWIHIFTISISIDVWIQILPHPFLIPRIWMSDDSDYPLPVFTWNGINQVF
jgi:hypothetical protein